MRLKVLYPQKKKTLVCLRSVQHVACVGFGIRFDAPDRCSLQRCEHDNPLSNHRFCFYNDLFIVLREYNFI